MKKVLAFFAAIGIVLLTACDRSQPRPIPVDVPPPVEQKNDSLSIFFLGENDTILDTAIATYRRVFPDVSIEIDRRATEGMEDNCTVFSSLFAEIMAGSGPDIIFPYHMIMDMEKMARNGAFADMEPFFQADNYDWSGFNQVVMDAGVWEGKRLIIPLEYTLPILYTSSDALAESGFSVENCKDFQGFLEEAEKFQQTPGQSRSLLRLYNTFSNFSYYGGIPYLDFDQGTVDLSSPELKRGLDVYQELQKTGKLSYDKDMISAVLDIQSGEALWIRPSYIFNGFIMDGGAIKTFSDLVMMPIRDTFGGIQAEITQSVAVRNNCENLQNAYEFLKIYLSEDLGMETIGRRWSAFSVRDSLNYAYYDFEVTNRTTPHIDPKNPLAGFDHIDPPTPEEFEPLMGYTREVTGAHFHTSMRYVRKGNFPVSKPLSLAPGDIFGNRTAFLLGQRGHDGDEKSALAVEGVDAFLFKVALHAALLQLANGGE